MSRVRFASLLLLGLLLVALLAWAGSTENFAPCAKSNDCKSYQCTKNRCAPSVQWNGHGKLGTECNNDGNCESRTCKSRRCVAPPTPKATSTPKAKATSTASGRSTPGRFIEDEPYVEPDEQPTPELVLDACSRKLIKDMDAADFPEIAVEICAMYDDGTIARALNLFEGGYGVGVSDTCRAIVGRSDEDVACGKKAFDALPKDDRDVPFKIPVTCVTKQTPEQLDRCTKDLMATVEPALREGKKQADAGYACATYDAKTLETAKKVVKAGYAGSFLLLCRMVDGRTSEELACARKDFADNFGEARSEYEFTMPPDCESKTPRKR